MAKFDLKQFLTNNRNEVIAAYEKLTKEQFFDGVSLKVFMLEVMHILSLNAKSDKRAAQMLSSMIEHTYYKHCSIMANDSRTDALRNKYQGTAYMALV